MGNFERFINEAPYSGSFFKIDFLKDPKGRQISFPKEKKPFDFAYELLGKPRFANTLLKPLVYKKFDLFGNTTLPKETKIPMWVTSTNEVFIIDLYYNSYYVETPTEEQLAKEFIDLLINSEDKNNDDIKELVKHAKILKR